MKVRIIRDRCGRPDLLDTTTQRVSSLIGAWKDATTNRRDRIGKVLARFGFHLTSRPDVPAAPRANVVTFYEAGDPHEKRCLGSVLTSRDTDLFDRRIGRGYQQPAPRSKL